jgi:hypothetical protein
MINLKEEENMFIEMVAFIMENGPIIREMVKEKYIIIMMH